ncbi:MAG: hypothetical protein ACT4O0_21600 [Pseudonocardia sp.]|jgi:hypothetical protein
MPLNWSEVQARYGDGGRLPTVAGGKTLQITKVDDQGVHIRNPLWSDVLARSDLEKAVRMIEQGRLTRHAGLFVEEYRAEVVDCRATSAAHLLKDFGFLE